MKCPECKAPANKSPWTRRYWRCSRIECNHAFFTPRRHQMPVNFKYSYLDRQGIEDTNDCMVKATAVAANIEYKDAHALYELAGRPVKSGTQIYKAKKAFRFAEEFGMFKVSEIDLNEISPLAERERTWEERENARRYGYGSKYRPVTFAKVREHVKQGRYIICNRTHAWAIVDGIAHDHTYHNGRTQIEVLYKVEPIQ